MTDRSHATGELRVYVKNVSDRNVNIVTSNLALMTSSNTYELAPERHVLIANGERIELKESLSKYSVVLLKPMEVTYLSGFTIVAQNGVVDYYVKPQWAQMHGVWGGRISTEF
ncbi:hypothetical protein [Alteromonas facilis]|uniref:hypothetical protein n=1 Tax=Alteromonas facilis TaxID=2048004 RepID=UPI000F5C923E|nr:hypothetical protein [Alteromonas facilis]